MTVEDFSVSRFQDYWGLSNGELAELTGKSLDTVNHWVSRGNSRRSPTPEILQSLHLIHLQWLVWDLERSHLPHEVTDIYERIRRRKGLS